MATDQTKPHTAQAAAWILGALVAAAAIGGALHSLIDLTLQKQILEGGAKTTGVRQAADSRDKEIMTRYGVVDAAQGVYRIPVARAMELEAQSPWRANYTPVATPAPVITPVAAATPAADIPAAQPAAEGAAHH